MNKLKKIIQALDRLTYNAILCQKIKYKTPNEGGVEKMNEHSRLIQELIDNAKYIELGKEAERHILRTNKYARTDEEFVSDYSRLRLFYKHGWSGNEKNKT